MNLKTTSMILLATTIGFSGGFAEDPASVATISESQLVDFEAYPAAVKQLVSDALILTRRNLGYLYGSNDPARGGMDCSGTMNQLLRSQGVRDVPRQSGAFYKWVWRESRFSAVMSDAQTTFEMERLKPGDLLFWSGTYQVERELPITHVMIYLGKLKADGRPVMMGSSSGRRFGGVARHGVSVFDFQFPRKGSVSESGTSPRFVGYGPIPGLEEAYLSELATPKTSKPRDKSQPKNIP
jgi:cell wall-associated NlpC family hydrolase